jgi:hypothetical protein
MVVVSRVLDADDSLALRLLADSSAQHIHNHEYDDPDCVYEMPIEREHFQLFTVFFLHLAAQRK